MLLVGVSLRRYALPLDFVRARLSQGSEVGLRLTLSVLLFIGATWLFAGVAEDVVTGDPLVAVDQAITQWFQRYSAPGVTRWMSRVTDAHDVVPLSVLGLAFALYLGWRRQGYWLLAFLLVLPGGMSLNLLLKQVFHRGRPVLDEPLLHLSSYSFPSGHVTAATLFYGVLAVYLARQAPDLGKRVALYAMAGVMVLLVAVTRVYLGAHHFSDVVAAAAWGTAWLVLCVGLVGALRRRAAHRRARLSH
ncbi:MAG: phosphatase PAP2 family protein [Caldimonas sp.]